MPHRDPRPISAVSHGVGLSGLVGLCAFVVVARHLGWTNEMAAMLAVLACAVPMVLWSLLIDKVHLRPSTGIDWALRRKPLRETFDISLVKLAGYWMTWGLIAFFYCIGRWYWTGQYHFAMDIMQAALPYALALSIPYIFLIDRVMIDPKDGAYAFGQWVLGTGEADKDEALGHLRSWAVKGFFTAFMISIVPGNFADVVRAPLAEIFANPVTLARWLIMAMFLVDVAVATVGYLLTMKPLDAHIRGANPYVAGWTAALMCYPPFVLMGNGGPLDYHYGIEEWTYWLDGHAIALSIMGIILVVLTGIYAWATVAFGLRFSNLTHRGIITHGPYRWSKHPAYVSKNLYWWLSTTPFLVTTGSLTDMVRNTVILAAVSGVYYWRARTEERHLMADPDYVAYAEWMERHGPIPRLIRYVTGKKLAAESAPAE